MARSTASGGRHEFYFRQAVQILRGELSTPPDFYGVISAAILGGTVLDHTRLEGAYPTTFAAVWQRIERLRLTCSVCGKPLSRGAKMPLRTDSRWDEQAYTYRHHDRHLDTELRRVFVGDPRRVYPDAAPPSSR